MIWGVGTGRCGTKSLAADYGGLHEPEPKIMGWGAQYARGVLPSTTLEELKHIIKYRTETNATLISDLQQSYIMNLIEEIDPDPKYVFLIRNPFDCIASFLLGGAFTETDFQGDNKAQPPYGWQDGISRIDRVLYHYTYTNIRIMDHLTKRGKLQKPWVVMFTNDLQSWENYYSKREFNFARKEAAYILERTSDIWEKAKQMWNYQDDNWFLQFEARAAKF